MTSPLDNLVTTGTLHREPPDALRRAGYRASNRYVVFQALPHTLGMGVDVWRVLAKAHQVRNQSENEGDLHVDERLVTDVVSACAAVLDALDALPPLR